MEKYYEIKYEKNKELTYASLWPQTWLEQVPANAPRLTAHLTISEAVVHHLSTGSSSNEFGNGDGEFVEIKKKMFHPLIATCTTTKCQLKNWGYD